ncbi:DUF3883 domain-containing protein [Thermodesulfovibrio sp. 3462-1]|jgi:hypothetical protein|uniref:DUF3883 domain-containing protein n=1 Tax=Thermodesulfovibrio obliviosus TaxID=3118332 RepID=A0AAU8H427_9BACT
MELKDLINKRKQWVNSSKENNFDFDSILAGLYADPSHFIYELLQNAEDEGATEVIIKLFKDKFEFYHNGKDFDLEDIDGVTGIGISKKKEDLNAIGKFGVGFKSVFAITQTPYIFSGEYKIKIEDFVVPVEINSNEKIDKTLIRLPFNHKYRSPEEIFNLTKKKLEELDLKTLLFLKNINEIKWETPSSSGHYLKESKNIHGDKNIKRVTIVSSSITEEYLVFRKPINIEDKELWVEVAYKLDKDENNKEIIVPELNSKLFVFFPTEKVTFLNFLIQGPLRTTPNRENIPLEDEQNKAIVEEIGNLVAESLLVIKNLGYLDVNFLNILPIDPEHKEAEYIYAVIYNKVKAKLQSEELLPSFDGTYTKASDALLARGKELTEFLNSSDLQKLFSKKCWLDTNITYDKTRELRDYLINELGVPEVDFESFARKITTEFLQTKSDEWIIDFYSRLLDQQSLWSDRGYSKGILRTKPIIRLENNEHIAPFDNNGNVQVYLPGETKSEYKTVKRVLTEKEQSLKFLKELGLTKPDIFAEIREFILPKYKAENPVKDEKYFDDFAKFLRGYETVQSETVQSGKKSEFIEELSDANFILAIKNNENKTEALVKGSKAYFPDEDLKNYFEGYQSVYFVSEEIFQRFDKGMVKKFLEELGVEDKPRRVEVEGNLTWEEKFKLRGNSGCTYDIYQKNYDYEGLDNFMNNITPEKSYLLWKLLLKAIEHLSSRQAQEFFKGEYKWFYYSAHSARFEAKFLKTLKQNAWLIDKNGNFRKPSEITFSELADSYKKDGANIEVLKQVLGFKPEIIEQLPEDERKILEIAKKHNLSPDELEKILSERETKLLEEEKEKEQWIPEVEPNVDFVKIQEVEPEKIITPDLSGQAEKVKIADAQEQAKENGYVDRVGQENNKRETIDKKAIGKWGEKYVYNALKKKYEKEGKIEDTDSGFKVINANNGELEIIWLNMQQDQGKGYDFVIRKNGTDVEYIEVKTKTQEGEELIEVTGTQWEFARKLFDQNEGVKYSFYVVSNAGKKDAEIRILRNPIKLWKEGKLYAHPVNFKL